MKPDWKGKITLMPAAMGGDGEHEMAEESLTNNRARMLAMALGFIFEVCIMECTWIPRRAVGRSCGQVLV